MDCFTSFTRLVGCRGCSPQHKAVFQQLGAGVKDVHLNTNLNNVPEISSRLCQ